MKEIPLETWLKNYDTDKYKKLRALSSRKKHGKKLKYSQKKEEENPTSKA